MRSLLLYASKNQKYKDATGAFIPQATLCKRFLENARFGGVTSLPFDPLISSRQRDFLALINGAERFNYLAYFGHGLRTGLPSAGFRSSDVGKLAGAIAARKAQGPLIITLYACSAAGAPGKDRDKLDGDGGFADLLRDLLSAKHGVKGWIDAHTVAGHTTTNRMTRRFYMNGESVGTGGAWLVAPGSPEWAAWSKRMRTKGDEMRFLFPHLTQTELLRELSR